MVACSSLTWLGADYSPSGDQLSKLKRPAIIAQNLRNKQKVKQFRRWCPLVQFPVVSWIVLMSDTLQFVDPHGTGFFALTQLLARDHDKLKCVGHQDDPRNHTKVH